MPRGVPNAQLQCHLCGQKGPPGRFDTGPRCKSRRACDKRRAAWLRAFKPR